MYKLVTIGALVAALAAPASAAAHGTRVHKARAQAGCPQALVFPPRRDYGLCGSRFYVRDPETGKVEAIPFGRLQHLGEGPDRP